MESFSDYSQNEHILPEASLKRLKMIATQSASEESFARPFPSCYFPFSAVSLKRQYKLEALDMGFIFWRAHRAKLDNANSNTIAKINTIGSEPMRFPDIHK